MAVASAAAMQPPSSSSSYFGAAEMDFLNPLEHPREFALLTAQNVLLWGGTTFLWQLLFSQYASWLEKKGFLHREAPEPTLPRGEMLRQGMIAISGVALPMSLALTWLRPKWTFDASLFGGLALLPYVFLLCAYFDTHYYFTHRLAHNVPWIYRLVHKKHHLPQAGLDAGSTSYMSFLEGVLVVGVPFLPAFVLPHVILKGNLWACLAAHYTTVCLFYLGHTGAVIKKSILPVFLLNPYLAVMAFTASASRPEDHTAHHERVMGNYGVFFRFWDEFCGTDAPPKRNAGEKDRLKDLPISWRVTLYNTINSFGFLSVLLFAAGAPKAFALALVLALAAPSLLFRFEAGCFRILGLKGLVTRLPFWDGLRRDLRVTLECDSTDRGGVAGLALASAATKGASSPPRAASPQAVMPLYASDDDGSVVVVQRVLRSRSRRTSPTLSSSSAAAAAAGPSSSSPKKSKKQPRPPQQQPQQQQQPECPPSPPSTPAQRSWRARFAPPRERTRSASPFLARLTDEDVVVDPSPANNMTTTKNNNKNKLYVYHPRGDMMRGAFFAFGPRGRGPAHPLAGERDVRLALPQAAARVLLRLPLVRELVALLGGVEPAAVTGALRSGASVAVCLPGPATRGPPRADDAPEAAPAFIRAALATRVPLVPVVAVGEAELAGRIPKVDKYATPTRPGCAVRVVFGEPVFCAEGESAQRLRSRFAAALTALAERHGAPPPVPADL